MKLRLKSVSPFQALVEGWCIMLSITTILALVPEIPPIGIGEGVNLALFFASAWPGLRAARLGLPRAKNFFAEIGISLLLTCGLGLILMSWRYLPSANDLLENNSFGSSITLIVLLLTAPAYLFWRLAGWGWKKWERLRRTRFMWSLNHAFLIVLIVFLLILFVILSSLMFPDVNPSAGTPLAKTLTFVIQLVFLIVLGLPSTLIPVLVVLLPVMAITSYIASRKLARRLEGLAQAAQRLSAGDLAARSSVEGEDEIAQLQYDFNRMAQELEKTSTSLVAERDRVTGLLKNQRELTASASHELRTPLAILSGYLEHSQERPDLPEGLAQDLLAMQSETMRLQNLIEDLFTLSRAEVNRLSLNIEEFDPLPVIRQTVEAVAPLAWKSRKVSVTANLPETCPALQADRLRVEQILRNLIQNGVRYTPPGGIVAVNLQVEASEICLRVSDTGEGIDPHDLPHIWEKFYQGRNADGERHSGLGLAIVRELSESMRGRVAVESALGEGSHFSVWLPRSAA